MNNKPFMARYGEAIFDITYLMFDLIAGLIFLISGHGNTVFILFGLMTLTLGFGDAFHLVPRVARAIRGETPQVRLWMDRGLQISSISCTIYYVFLFYIWKLLYPDHEVSTLVTALLFASAIARIVICLLPQNGWTSEHKSRKLSAIRNGIFAITGLIVLVLFATTGNDGGYGLGGMSIAIFLSFVCYYIVICFVSRNPKLGMFMIPKTIAYVWMICLGLRLLGRM